MRARGRQSTLVSKPLSFLTAERVASVVAWSMRSAAERNLLDAIVGCSITASPNMRQTMLEIPQCLLPTGEA